MTITAAGKEGFAFKNWTVKGGSVTLDNENANPTTFTMGDSEVTIVANYDEKKITGLTAESARDDYLEGETFKLKGNAVLEYEDGTTKKLNSSDVTVSPEGPLTADVKEVTDFLQQEF